VCTGELRYLLRKGFIKRSVRLDLGRKRCCMSCMQLSIRHLQPFHVTMRTFGSA
jgi:hypothetical protein